MDGGAPPASSTPRPATWSSAKGQVGDRFYVVDRGACEVAIGERSIRRLGPGDAFGEIALLRRVPRTASVWATEPTSLLTLDRQSFLRAVTGHVGSRTVADDLVEQHLEADAADSEAAAVAGVPPGVDA